MIDLTNTVLEVWTAVLPSVAAGGGSLITYLGVRLRLRRMEKRLAGLMRLALVAQSHAPLSTPVLTPAQQKLMEILIEADAEA